MNIINFEKAKDKLKTDRFSQTVNLINQVSSSVQKKKERVYGYLCKDIINSLSYDEFFGANQDEDIHSSEDLVKRTNIKKIFYSRTEHTCITKRNPLLSFQAKAFTYLSGGKLEDAYILFAENFINLLIIDTCDDITPSYEYTFDLPERREFYEKITSLLGRDIYKIYPNYESVIKNYSLKNATNDFIKLIESRFIYRKNHQINITLEGLVSVYQENEGSIYPKIYCYNFINGLR